MAVITTAQLRSIANLVICLHPGYRFVMSNTAKWSPTERTVYYPSITSETALNSLLHELGHALSGHSDFSQDIILLKMEREAWTKALELAITVDYHIDEIAIESALDGYRNWLYERSRCPTCNSTGIQNKQMTFHCPICNQAWRANDARQCGLKRIKQ